MMMGYYGGAGFEFTADGFHKAPTDHDAPLEAQCVFWELGWGAVDVEVDPATGRVILHKLIVSGDAGQAINPLVCRGQDEGSAVMGIGQALFEEMVYDGTRLVNGETLAYRVPMAQDLPATFTSITQEQGHGPGPFGSKGMDAHRRASAARGADRGAAGGWQRHLQRDRRPDHILAADAAKGKSGIGVSRRGAQINTGN